MSIEAMKLALEALHDLQAEDYEGFEPTLTALCQAIEQAQKQEPVATSTSDLRKMLDIANHADPSRWEIGFRNIVAILYGSRHKFEIKDVVEHVRELSTSPPQRQPLTRGQIREIEIDVSLNPSFDYITPAEQLCRAIEAAHGITGAKE